MGRNPLAVLLNELIRYLNSRREVTLRKPLAINCCLLRWFQRVKKRSLKKFKRADQCAYQKLQSNGKLSNNSKKAEGGANPYIVFTSPVFSVPKQRSVEDSRIVKSIMDSYKGYYFNFLPFTLVCPIAWNTTISISLGCGCYGEEAIQRHKLELWQI